MGDRGILVIVSSPSGAGKTTLARRLLAEFESVEFSVSYTTRPVRPGEVNGRDYFFVDDATFERMVAAGDFAEWALVHGNRYGTARTAIQRALEHGRDVVFDVDWQGGNELARGWPEEALRVFILPPDIAVLEMRLRRRATDTEEVIARRLAKAIAEMRHHREYEFRIVNDDLERAYGCLRALYLHRKGDSSPAFAEVAATSRGAAVYEYAESLLKE